MDEHRYRRMFASSPVAQALSDAEGLFVEVNAAYCELVGLPSSELIGRSATVHTHPGDLALHGSVEDLMAAGVAAERSVKVEVRVVRPNDEIRWVLLTLVPFTGPADAEWTLIAALDITERKQVEAGILLASRTDQLTGALNRRGWSDYAVSVVDDNSVDTVVAVLDLDHFKQFNDTFGHAAGDKLLRDFASTARDCIGVDGLLARWGGEEFVITLRNCDRRGALGSLKALAAATTPSGVTFSAGYTLQRPNEGLRHTLHRADTLMFQAKRAGRNRMITDAPHRNSRPSRKWDELHCSVGADRSIDRLARPFCREIFTTRLPWPCHLSQRAGPSLPGLHMMVSAERPSPRYWSRQARPQS